MEFASQTPVFFHVPKNAGTYFLNRSFAFAAIANKNTCESSNGIIRLDIKSAGIIKYRLVCFDKNSIAKMLNYFTHILNNRVYEIDIDNCSKDIFDFLDVFAVIVCGEGFRDYKKELYPLLGRDFKPFSIISLRDPFSRAVSMYYYAQSSQSDHENCHDKFRGMSFEDYICSSLLEDSWLIRMVTMD